MSDEDRLNKIEYSAEEKIARRNNWLKIFVCVVVLFTLPIKLGQADFSLVFASFDFSDLLALFLAMFSIALAILFYLKATETSNTFYNNTYRFTQNVSEILGRVEAGFGERLKHLDEGYSDVKTALENIPIDRGEAEKEILEEKEHVRRAMEEKQQNRLSKPYIKNATDKGLDRRLRALVEDSAGGFREDLIKFKILDEGMDLTEFGRAFIRERYSRVISFATR